MVSRAFTSSSQDENLRTPGARRTGRNPLAIVHLVDPEALARRLSAVES
jgi:hypothetical protein